MATSGGLRIEGLKELDEAFAQLTKATGRSVLKRALMAAAKPMVEEARRLAPDDPKTPAPDLHTSIEVRPGITNKVGSAEYAAVMEGGGSREEAQAALREARKAAAGQGSYAIVHLGPIVSTKRAAIKATVQEFGSFSQPAQPYMRPAFEGKKQAVMDGIANAVRIEIDKTVARAAARRARKAT